VVKNGMNVEIMLVGGIMLTTWTYDSYSGDKITH